MFLYRIVLEQKRPWLEDVVRARRRQRLDVDFLRSQITIRSGKGAKDRVTTLPGAARPGLLRHLAAVSYRADRRRVFEAAAHALQTEPLWYEVDSVSGFEERFKQMTTQQVHAVIILGSPFTFQHMRLITELAGKHRMPATYEAKDFVQAGGLMSYGVDFEDLSRAARSSWTGFSAGRSPHCCRSNSQRSLSSL